MAEERICKATKAYGNILVFNALTGLRPKEACESIKILNGKGQEVVIRRLSKEVVT